MSSNSASVMPSQSSSDSNCLISSSVIIFYRYIFVKAAIANKLFANWVHCLCDIAVDIAHFFPIQVKTIFFSYMDG